MLESGRGGKGKPKGGIFSRKKVAPPEKRVGFGIGMGRWIRGV